MRTETKPAAVTWRHPLVIAHAGVVAGLIVLLAVIGWISDVGASENIGAGFVCLLLGILGAPWSLAYFALDFTTPSDSGATEAAAFVCLTALVNVVLHALIRWWSARRAVDGKVGNLGPARLRRVAAMRTSFVHYAPNSASCGMARGLDRDEPCLPHSRARRADTI